MKKRKRKAPSITMPKPNKKKVDKPVMVVQSRAANSGEMREEEEYSFNKYTKKKVKVMVVLEAEEVKDLKKKRTRR